MKMGFDKMWSKWSKIALQMLVMINAVFGQPNFRIEPSELTVLQGEEALIYCVINDYLPSTHHVNWYRDDNKISTDGNMEIPDTRFEIEVKENRGTYNLRITDVQLSDDTLYDCRVTDSSPDPLTLLESSKARLEVHHVPEHKYPSCFPLDKESFEAGEEITITCQSTRGNPPVTLRWIRQGENLPIHPYDDGNRNIDYTFTIAPENNGDIFQCKLTTMADQNIRRSCSLGPLDVRYPPAEVDIGVPANIEADQEIELVCNSDANPSPVYSWTFADEIDQNRITYSDNDQRITFTSKITDDGLSIGCNATNDHGTAGAKTTLDIKPPLTHPIYGTTPSRTLTPKDDSSQDGPNKPKTDSSSSNNIVLKPEVLAIIASTLTLILLVLIILVVITCRCRPQNPKAVTQMPQMIYGQYGQYGPTSIQGWEQGSIYFEPKDRISVRDMPTWQRPAPWHRNVAVQVPWVEEPPYEEIGQNWDEGMTLEI